MAAKYAELIYNGLWLTPLKKAMDAFFASTQEKVSGVVRLKLYKGQCQSSGRKSPYSLYQEDLATFGRDEIYNQKDATGFINLFGLPLQVEALAKQAGETRKEMAG